MIIKKIEATNFLSYETLKYDFLNTGVTIIGGNNGSGKSTLIDALLFSLYNKAFRPINKPLLVNNIKKKGLFVKVEIEIDNHEYIIERGIKPNIFNIFKDGVLIDQDSTTADYQSMLEVKILKLTCAEFKQISVLGKANYIPFLRLSQSERRKTIDNLLDLDKLIKYEQATQDALKQSKTSKVDSAHTIEVKDASLLTEEKTLEFAEYKHKEASEKLERYKSEIEELNSKLNHSDSIIKELEPEYIPDLEIISRDDIVSTETKCKLELNDIIELLKLISPSTNFNDDLSIEEVKKFIDDNYKNPEYADRPLKEFDDNKLTALGYDIKTLKDKLQEPETTIVDDSLPETAEQPNFEPLRAVSVEIKRLEKEANSIEDTKICPTCKTVLSSDSALKEHKEELNQQIEVLTNELIDLKLVYKEQEAFYNKVESNNKVIKYNDYLKRIKSLESAREKLVEEYNAVNVYNEKVNEANKLKQTYLNLLDRIKKYSANLIKLETLKSEFSKNAEQSLKNQEYEKAKATNESLLESIHVLLDKIKSINLDESKKPIEESLSKINEMKEVIKSTKSKLVEIEKDISDYTMIIKMFRSGAIRNIFINKSIIIFNEYIKMYLNFFKMPIEVGFDNNLFPQLSNNLDYFSLSEGEKLRVDISLLFAWRKLVKNRTNSSTNVLILDEIFDGSLDSGGDIVFNDIIEEEKHNTGIIIISPKDKIVEYDARIINAEKDVFSTLV